MKKSTWISKKVKRIMSEGVRRNTMRPFNKKTNPRRPVKIKQAVAISENMYLRRNK